MYELEIHYLDVGQGDCTLIVIKNTNTPANPHAQFDPQIERTVLIDCGTTSTRSVFDTAPEDTLLQNLLNLRIQRLNVVVITHYDEDHFSGIVALLNLARNQPAVRNYFLDAAFYDQGLILRKNVQGPGFRWYTRYNHHNNNPLPGMDLIYQYFDHITFLNTTHNTNIQRITERVFVGWPRDYYHGDWTSRNTAVVHHHESGVFNNTLSQQILIQSPLLTPTTNVPNTFTDRNINGNAWREVTTLPCHHLLGQDILNPPGLPALNNISLTCVAANGYTWNRNHPTHNFSSLLAYTATGDKNKFSLGFILDFNGFTHWFGGDLEDNQEIRVVNYLNTISNHGFDVIKASHHGSAESTSDQFLLDTAPDLVVISSGNYTKHHHPHQRVIGSLTNAASVPRVFMTNAPFFPGMLVPSFYDPGALNGRFYISGSSLENQPGHMKLHITNAHHRLHYWEQNLRLNISNSQSILMPMGLNHIPMTQFINILNNNQLEFYEYTDINGRVFPSIRDTATGQDYATFYTDIIIRGTGHNAYEIGSIEGGLAHYDF